MRYICKHPRKAAQKRYYNMKRIQVEELVHQNINTIITESPKSFIYDVNQVLQDIVFMDAKDLKKLKNYITEEIFQIPY